MQQDSVSNDVASDDLLKELIAAREALRAANENLAMLCRALQSASEVISPVVLSCAVSEFHAARARLLDFEQLARAQSSVTALNECQQIGLQLNGNVPTDEE